MFAIALPMFFSQEFSAFLPASIESPTARLGISAATLFVGAMVFGGVISYLIRKLIGASGLGFADRLLGTGFGIVRGVVILALVAMLATAFPSIPQERWWQQSRLLPQILRVSKILHARLPAEIKRRFDLSAG